MPGPRSLASCAALAAAAACAPTDGPSLATIAPAAARPGARVTVTGARLCGGTAAADGTCARLPSGGIDFSLTPPMYRAAVVSWSDQRVVVTVPATVAIGPTSVYATVDGRTSNALDFEVLP